MMSASLPVDSDTHSDASWRSRGGSLIMTYIPRSQSGLTGSNNDENMVIDCCANA